MPHRTCSPLSDSILFPSPDSAKPPPHPQSTSLVFKTLPPELFQLIASFIPFSAAVSLTLTCRKASIILGSRYLDWLNVKGNRETLEFIKLLERDLPRHIVCVECEVLHSHREFYLTLYIQPQFDSITFLLAMKLHRHGHDSSKHLSHLTRSGTNRRTTYIHHWEAKPRIMDGHYLLRHQTWLLFRNPAAYEMALETIDLRVCPGWYSGSFYLAKWVTQHPNWRSEIAGPPRLTRMLACRASHLDNAELNSSCQNCTGLTKCEYCPTEFQLDAKKFNEHGVALVITRWLDLGEGRNLQDDWFRSHLWCYKGQPVRPGAGSIKSAYEGRHSNIEKLLTPRYKMEMLRHSTHAYRANAFAHASAPATGCLGNSMQVTEKSEGGSDISGPSRPPLLGSQGGKRE